MTSSRCASSPNNGSSSLARPGDVAQESAALNMLATSAFLGGDLDAARRRYEEAVEVARTTGDDEVVSGSLANFGKFERDNGNVARSRELLEESLAISRAVGNEVDVAWAVKELAQTAIAEGDVRRRERLLGGGLRDRRAARPDHPARRPRPHRRAARSSDRAAA